MRTTDGSANEFGPGPALSVAETTGGQIPHSTSNLLIAPGLETGKVLIHLEVY